jgi:hypothetical protein
VSIGPGVLGDRVLRSHVVTRREHRTRHRGSPRAPGRRLQLRGTRHELHSSRGSARCATRDGSTGCARSRRRRGARPTYL